MKFPKKDTQFQGWCPEVLNSHTAMLTEVLEKLTWLSEQGLRFCAEALADYQSSEGRASDGTWVSQLFLWGWPFNEQIPNIEAWGGQEDLMAPYKEVYKDMEMKGK